MNNTKTNLKRLASVFLSLALIITSTFSSVGLSPITAYAADITITWNSSIISSINLTDVGQSYNDTTNGITATWSGSGMGTWKGTTMDLNGSRGPVFSVADSTFTKIELNSGYARGVNLTSGWSINGYTFTWTGNSNSVTFSYTDEFCIRKCNNRTS